MYLGDIFSLEIFVMYTCIALSIILGDRQHILTLLFSSGIGHVNPWCVLAVSHLKPLGFPEVVHSPSSAESELSLLSFRAHSFLFSGKDHSGALFWAALFSCGCMNLYLDVLAGRNEITSDELCFRS